MATTHRILGQQVIIPLQHPISNNPGASQSIPEHPKMEMNSSMDERIPTDAGGGRIRGIHRGLPLEGSTGTPISKLC